MLLDVPTVLLGTALAAAGFVVVVFVTALVLRLIGVVLGDGGENPPNGPAAPVSDAQGETPVADPEPGATRGGEASPGSETSSGGEAASGGR